MTVILPYSACFQPAGMRFKGICYVRVSRYSHGVGGAFKANGMQTFVSGQMGGVSSRREHIKSGKVRPRRRRLPRAPTLERRVVSLFPRIESVRKGDVGLIFPTSYCSSVARSCSLHHVLPPFLPNTAKASVLDQMR